MFRQGKNPKDTHTADDTADHTPQSPTASAGAGSSYGSAPASNAAATPTEAYQQSVYTHTASKRIEMGRVAKVTGNIQTPALVIENGALFEGSCRMVQVKEQAEKATGAAAAASSTAAATSGVSSSSSSSTSPSA